MNGSFPPSFASSFIDHQEVEYVICLEADLKTEAHWWASRENLWTLWIKFEKGFTLYPGACFLDASVSLSENVSRWLHLEYSQKVLTTPDLFWPLVSLDITFPVLLHNKHSLRRKPLTRLPRRIIPISWLIPPMEEPEIATSLSMKASLSRTCSVWKKDIFLFSVFSSTSDLRSECGG